MVQPQHSHRPPLRPVLEAYVNVTVATYTAKAGDRVFGVNRAGTVTVILPATEVRKVSVYTCKDESGAATTNNITVATEGGETIDGSAWEKAAVADLDGIGSDDHHAQTHASSHSSRGADAVKLDDLAAPTTTPTWTFQPPPTA